MDEAEAWLGAFLASLGAIFPEPVPPQPEEADHV